MRKIWEKYNVSLPMVLPNLSPITDGIDLKHKEGRKYPFIKLCFDYGLINTYLLNSNGNFDGRLYLEFDPDKVTSNNKNTTKKYYSLNEVFFNSDKVSKTKRKNGSIYYGIDIDEKYHDDIHKIIESKYSELSEDYKKSISYGEKQKEEEIIILKKWEKDDARFIMLNDLAFSICNKKKNVKNWFKKYFGTDVNEDVELFVKFKEEDEKYI